MNLPKLIKAVLSSHVDLLSTTHPEADHDFHIWPHCTEVHLCKSGGGKHDQLRPTVCLQVGLHQQRNLAAGSAGWHSGRNWEETLQWQRPEDDHEQDISMCFSAESEADYGPLGRMVTVVFNLPVLQIPRVR